MALTDDPPVTVRRAGIDDAAALARLRWLWRTVERAEYGLSAPEFETAFRAWWRSHQDSHIAFIAQSEGETVGMAWLAVFERIPQPRDFRRLAGNVQSVFVLDEYRNRGIGNALVDSVIAEARERHVGYLIVHPSRRAYPLYERLGFSPTTRLLHMELDSPVVIASPE